MAELIKKILLKAYSFSAILAGESPFREIRAKFASIIERKNGVIDRLD